MSMGVAIKDGRRHRRDAVPDRYRPEPNEIAQALTGRPHLSYSEIRTFQACPLKWHFQYVEQAEPEQISAAMVMGSSIHAAIEHHLACVLASDETPSLDQLMEVYRNRWQEEATTVPLQFGRSDTAESLNATARRMLEQFQASSYANPEDQIIGIEEPMRIRLADDLPDLAARVDLITLKEGELTITDFKTARSMWNPDTAEEHAEQLVLYGHTSGPMARSLGASMQLRFVVLTKAKAPKINELPIQANPNRVARSTAVIRQVFQAMQSGNVYPAPSAMSCTGCPFQKRCEAWRPPKPTLQPAAWPKKVSPSYSGSPSISILGAKP